MKPMVIQLPTVFYFFYSLYLLYTKIYTILPTAGISRERNRKKNKWLGVARRQEHPTPIPLPSLVQPPHSRTVPPAPAELLCPLPPSPLPLVGSPVRVCRPPLSLTPSSHLPFLPLVSPCRCRDVAVVMAARWRRGIRRKWWWWPPSS